MNTQERAAGADVWPQITCRPLTFQMTMADPFTFNTVPSFQALMDRPVEERLAAYRDPEWRRERAGRARERADLPAPTGRRHDRRRERATTPSSTDRSDR